MEGISKFNYKDKIIIYIDYSNIGNSKEKILQLIQTAKEEYEKYPPKSALTLINVANIHFDADILNAFKNTRNDFTPYEKKIAVIGAKGLLIAAYNFVIGSNNDYSVERFDSELEAKEWLVCD